MIESFTIIERVLALARVDYLNTHSIPQSSGVFAAIRPGAANGKDEPKSAGASKSGGCCSEGGGSCPRDTAGAGGKG